MKRCTKCQILKGLDEFYAQKNGLYGRTGECKECRKSRASEWRKEHIEEVKTAVRHYDWLNPSSKAQRNKRFRDKNPDYMKKYRKKLKDGDH